MKSLLSLLFLLVLTPSACSVRGELVSSRLKYHIPAGEAARIASPYGTVHPSHAVDVYEVVYKTLDGSGKVVEASGAVAVPFGAPPGPVVSIQHGTVFEKNAVPSGLPAYWLGDGLLFASSGYLTVMPDYVGYGVSSGSFHPYLHARSLAGSVIDLLRAVRRFAGWKGIRTDDRLFLVGYSEGGYATMAAHRELEEQHAGEFRVTASAPMAGPYDPMVTMDVLLQRGSPESVPFIAFAFWAYNRIYGLGDLQGIIKEPYRTRIIGTGASGSSYEVRGALPARAAELFEPAFLLAWRGNDARQVKKAALENGLTEWRPLAPVALFHCRDDTVVPVENAMKARTAFLARGAALVRLEERDLGDHGSCFVPLMTEAKLFFDTFKGMQ